MSKVFVVLELEMKKDLDPNFIPWSGLLADVAIVENWSVRTPRTREEAEIRAMHDYISAHDFETDEEAWAAMVEASRAGELYAPEGIYIWEPFERFSMEYIVELIETDAGKYINTFEL
jgi:hypothetical protein